MKIPSKQYVYVAVPVPVDSLFTYELSEERWNSSFIGRRVVVSFGRQNIIGYIVGAADTPNTRNTGVSIKRITAVVDSNPIVNKTMLELTKWIGEYYCCSWGEALDNVMPGLLKQKRVAIDQIVKKNAFIKNDVFEGVHKDITLTDEQKAAMKQIEAAIEKKAYHKTLIFGVTGSGKTELYIRAIKKTLESGRGAICLVPEIALTTHLKNYFLAHFPESLAIFHSRLTQREKFLIWKDIYEGRKNVVLGPRSALFAPLESCGIIIVDEEHENTYKQNDVPRYHVREAAEKRAGLESAVLLCGGATPSLEIMYQTQSRRCNIIKLTKRVVNRPLPEVKIIDMKHEVRGRKRMLLSQYLKDRIEDTLSKKEGILLFLNRRGFATSVTCFKCGETVQCDSCRLAYTYHQGEKKLLCHYCSNTIKAPEHCPACGNNTLYYGGIGTERIESHIARLFPTAVVDRFDTDRIRKKGAHESVLNDFKKKKIDILIGTQMIAKGLDFPHVTLVGVINADTVLGLPDFRSTERTFQLLTQVAGRAGRGDDKGLVAIQTYSPMHYAIKTAARHDFEAFYGYEIKRRKELNYPPFSHLINIIVRGKVEKNVREFCIRMKEHLTQELRKFGLDMLGPAPLPFYHLKGYFRWHIMIKGENLPELNPHIKTAIRAVKKTSAVQMAVDVDPVNIL